jgi:hypothetical protein
VPRHRHVAGWYEQATAVEMVGSQYVRLAVG